MEWVNLLSDNRRKDKYKHKINNSDETHYELALIKASSVIVATRK